MTVFLAGGTGTPKLLAGARQTLDPADVTVVGNTGDDVELGGLLVCPDVDTVLFDAGGVLDRDTWWGVADDTAETHEELQRLSAEVDIPATPRYLPDDQQTAGRRIANWRRFSAAGEFMHIGDRDRAVHLLRTSLLDEGHTLTEVTRTLADAFGIGLNILPMSDDPVSSIIHTPDGEMHFQEFWVAERGEPVVEAIEFRGAPDATTTGSVHDAIHEGPVVIGPSNPITSIGPMLALEDFRDALEGPTVVAVSPFVEDQVFSGPAAKLMDAVGYEPSTRGVADAYPFADAFVLDAEDGTELDRPVVQTDTQMDDDADAARVWQACEQALELAGDPTAPDSPVGVE